MNVEELRAFCLALPHATEDVKWGNDLTFCIGKKMFAVTGLETAVQSISFKCTPEKFAENAKIELVGEPENLQIFLNGRDVSNEIRTAEVGQAASVVSTISEVRKVLVGHQRTLGENAANGCVLDGRDIGTVVFPNADVKFFLTAKPEARAQRRFLEDTERGRVTTYEVTLAEINSRDERDVSREDSPLSIAADAVVIDTSELDLTEVFEQMMAVVGNKQK